MIQINIRRNGDTIYPRIFSAGPFRWQLRSGADASDAVTLGSGTVDQGTVTPVDGRADLAPFTLGFAACYFLVAMPVFNGLPLDGEEDNQPDHRAFVQLR